jgi:Flp pilus assembly pilin Flp
MRSLARGAHMLQHLFYSLSLRAWASLRLATPGQGLVEYGLILVLIMVVCVGILTMTGNIISEVWYSKLVPALDR